MKFINKKTYCDNFGIYQIKNISNNCVYVGQTKASFQKRFWQHNNLLSQNRHFNKQLQYTWNIYGSESFVFEVLYVCNDDDDVDALEEQYILDARNRTMCFNILNGSSFKNSNVGELNRRRLLGTQLSEQTKQKMSKTRTGKRQYKKRDRLTDEQAIHVKQLLIDGYSSKEIMNLTGIEYKVINNIISCDAYKTLYVDGWDKYREKHDTDVKKKKAITQKLHSDIVELFVKYQMPKSKIADYLSVSWHTVDDHLKNEMLC